MTDADRLHRTAKQLLESGQARTMPEAEAILQTLILQIDVGPQITESVAAQAALMTAVNAGARTFLGGVRVRTEDDAPLSEGWGAGKTSSQTIVELGGEVVRHLDDAHPTIVIGEPGRTSTGSAVMHTAWSGWSGGVLEGRPGPPGAPGIALAGVVAGALGVCEAFQRCCGSILATRRDIGISLWKPDADWLAPEAAGPRVAFLPTALWLLGLGHLGQAYAWSLGLLPYTNPAALSVYLMDTDALVEGNLASGLLSLEEDVGKRKTRVVARRLQSRGFKTAIVERLFDEHTHPTSQEPSIALAGFDSPEPRRLLGRAGFGRVIDGGLGGGVLDYLRIAIHTFPSQLDSAEQFDSTRRAVARGSDPYEDELERLVEMGATRAEAQCGITEIAGISVAAAFVGAIAAALVIADVLRSLHEGSEPAIVSLDLRTPTRIAVVPNSSIAAATNPGFTSASDPSGSQHSQDGAARRPRA